jgi:hypothetical protein
LAIDHAEVGAASTPALNDCALNNWILQYKNPLYGICRSAECRTEEAFGENGYLLPWCRRFTPISRNGRQDKKLDF